MTAEDHPDLRASDVEREHTIDTLRDAAGEGRLTFEELADRIELAADATTRGQLERVTRDLPATATATAAGAGAVAQRTGAEVAVPIAQSSVFGDVRRAGAWVVPAQSSWRSVFGDVVLDLRNAHVGAPEVTIEANSVFGDVDLLVPEGVLVEVRCRSVLGDIRQQAGGVAPAGAPRVILTGGSFFGDIHVRARRVRERIADHLLGRGRPG